MKIRVLNGNPKRDRSDTMHIRKATTRCLDT